MAIPQADRAGIITRRRITQASETQASKVFIPSAAGNCENVRRWPEAFSALCIRKVSCRTTRTILVKSITLEPLPTELNYARCPGRHAPLPENAAPSLSSPVTPIDVSTAASR
jgi:hypothetical protein